MIYVVAHDGGYGGHSLPVLAFEDKASAFKWIDAQPECFSVVAVPVYPDFPAVTWFRLEAETR